MKQILAILGILTFILCTLYILNADDTKKIKRVYIQNQSMSLIQQGTGITSSQINFSNPEIKVEQEQNTYNSNSRYSTTTTSKNNTIDKYIQQFDSENSGGNNPYTYTQTQTHYTNPPRPQQGRNLNPHIEPTPKPEIEHGFMNLDISWNTWKSNFINRILDDSMAIHSLNNYNIGTWFYYSFEVTNTGEIQNIKITSISLKKEDKEAVIRMIQSYAHKDITAFPKNSKRKKAKVDAIMLLGDTESKSSPNDFNDTERVRIHY